MVLVLFPNLTHKCHPWQFFSHPHLPILQELRISSKLFVVAMFATLIAWFNLCAIGDIAIG